MKPFEQQTYYEILEVPVTAPDEEIRAAYERAIEMYSPDSIAVYTLVDPGQIDALRARLTEAMEILTEPDLRAEYDRMIGVSRADANTVANMATSLVEAASAVAPSAPVAAAPAPASAPEAPAASTPVASTVAAAPAPSTAPAVAEAGPASAPTPVEPPTAPVQQGAAAEPPAAAPTPPAVSPAPEHLVVPGTMTPRQIHAAFRSYTLSYVPLLVPAPTVTGVLESSPFSPPSQPESTPVAQGAPREAQAPAPQPPSTAPAVEAAAAPVAEAPVEPAPAAPSAPAVSVSAEPSQPIPAQPVEEPSRPPEPAPAAATPAAPAPALEHPEEEELSGARAPRPSPADARPAASRPGAPTGRYSRISTTPPPLHPSARRTPQAAAPAQPGRPGAEPGKGSARPGQGTGLDLEEAQQIAQESAIATAEAALAQVAAKAREQPRPKPVELPPNTEFNGEVLRQVRESRGLSLHQLAERTRISSKHLENIEADRYAALPATVYLRGMIMSVARELTLDPLRVSRSYLALATAPKKK